MNDGISVLEGITKETGFSGDQGHRYFYEQEYPGQSNYLIHRCFENHIRAEAVGKRVMLYAKTKLPEFLKLVEESKRFPILQDPVMQSPSMAVVEGATLLGVVLRDFEMSFVTQSHFPEFLMRVYKKEIPRFTNYQIFNTKKEMVDVLMNKYNILV